MEASSMTSWRSLYFMICIWVTSVSAQPTIQASSTSTIAGQERTLACYISSAESTSTFPIRWYKDGIPLTGAQEETTPLPGAGGMTTYTSFYKYVVTAADNLKVISCLATFPSGTTSATYNVYVSKGPDTPVINGPNVTVSGRSSSWTCVVDGASNTAPNVFWQFANGTRLDVSLYQNSGSTYIDSNNLEIHKETSVTTLNVTSGAPPFSLTCQAVHLETSTSTSASIAVTVYSPPQVNGGGGTYVVTSGNNVMLNCTIESVPPLTFVTWYKDGGRVSMSEGRYSGASTRAPSLTISGVAKADTGYYLCSGGNAVASSNGTASYLNVTYKPVITYSVNPVGGNSGSNVNLSCVIDANPPYTSLAWFKKDAQGAAIPVTTSGSSKYSGGTPSTPTLTIYSLVSSDAGLYLCAADNSEGRGQGADLRVEVFYPPNVNAGVSMFDVDLGGNVTFPCDYDAFPAPYAIVWQKGGRNLTVPSLDGRITGGNVSTPGLTLFRLQINDSDIYRCEVWSAVGMGSTGDIRLNVLYIPIVTTPHTLYTIHVGSNVTLECSIMAYPVVENVTWYRNGVEIATTPGKYSGADLVSPSLTVSGLTAADAGNYNCQATNSLGIGRGDVIRLDVQYPPNVSAGVNMFDVNLGGNVTLACNYVAFPAPYSIVWQKGGRNLTVPSLDGRITGGNVSTPGLILFRLQINDSAIYRCEVWSALGMGSSGDIRLNVLYTPIVTTPQTLYTINAGSNVTLQCSIMAYPVVENVTWYRNGVEFVLTLGKYSGADLNSPNLTLYDLTAADAGNYTCHATNFLGSGRGDVIKLDVQYPPNVNAGVNRVDVNLGGNVTLPCKYDAFPLPHTILWQKGGRNLTVPSLDGRITGGNVSTPGLTLVRLQINDSAIYRCEVWSALGMGSTGDIRLNVLYTPIVTTPQTLYTVKVGNIVTLQCSAMAYPFVASVTWYRNGVELALTPGKYSGADRDSPSLTVSDLTAADAGNYTCQATSSLGSGRGDIIRLDIQYAPVILLNATSYTSNVTQTLTISCAYDANPQPTTVQWTKNSQIIDVINSGGKYAGSTPSVPSLTIRQLTSSDAGLYVCSANNSVGPGYSQNVTVIVQYTPVVTTPQTLYTIKAGSNVTLQCSAVAYPFVESVAWYRNGVALALTPGKNSGAERDNPSLTVSGLTAADAGNYTCQATNSLGSGRGDVIKLDVQYAPVILLNATSYTSNVTQTLTISCAYDANPQPTTVQWTKNSQIIDVINSGGKYAGSTLSVPSLTIRQLTRSDAGIYVCSANNSVGPGYSNDVTVNVQYPPEFNSSGANFIRLKGENITLVCLATANPSPSSVIWYKGGVPLDVTTPGGRYQGGTVAISNLTIFGLQQNDSSDAYVCSVTNALGTTNSSIISLNVQYAPEIVSSSSPLSGVESSALTIPCTYDANPQPHQIVWNKNGAVLNTSSSRYSGRTPGTPGLTINSLLVGDTGSYRCTVTSSLGSASTGDIAVTVTYAPKVSTSGVTSRTADENQNVTIPCVIDAVPNVTSVRWLRNGLSLDTSDLFKYGVVSTASPSLTIWVLANTDAGEYACEATNVIGVGRSSNVTLVVRYKPILKVLPAINRTENERTVILCEVEAVPAVTSLNWYQGGQLLDTSDPTRYVGGSTAVPSLTIVSAQASDGGNYVCAAGNAAGNSTSSVTVLIVFYKPILKLTQSRVQAKLGETVTLTLTVSAIPPVTSLTWRRRRPSEDTFSDVNLAAAGSKYLGGTPASPGLLIAQLSSSDAAEYLAVANNSVGSGVTGVISLTVAFPPTSVVITSNASHYTEGERAFLQCSSDGYPAPDFRWYKGASLTPASLTAAYVIATASSSDNGPVRCEAYNAEGSNEATVQLVVYYKPRPGANLKNMTSALNNFVTLTCDTDSNPAPSAYTWRHNGAVVTGPTATSQQLTVEVVNASQFGAYGCLATNLVATSDPIVIYLTQDTSGGGGDNGGGNTGQSTEDTSMSTATLVLIIIICIIILVVIILIIVFFCTTRGLCKKKEQQQGQRVAPLIVRDGGTYNKANGLYHKTPIPPISSDPRYAKSNGHAEGPILASPKPVSYRGRIDLEEDVTAVPPLPANGHAPLGHGLVISLPGGDKPKPHHLPPLGQDGGAQEAEPAELEKPKRKRKKHRRRRDGEDAHFSSPQHDPSV